MKLVSFCDAKCIQLYEMMLRRAEYDMISEDMT